MLILGLGGALLAVALVALVVGLLAGSGGWLIASLACTALAAVLLVVQLRAGRSLASSVPAADAAAADAAAADDSAADDSADSNDANASAITTPAGADELPVWVIDGAPDYHRPHCDRLTGADAEPVPRAQALDDGFTACAQCRPAQL